MVWSLQVLRFVAALMIVYVHAAQVAASTTGSPGTLPQEWAIAGRAGVDIFFVLSGIIITKTAQGLAAEDFVWRRFRRIIPFYFVCCIPAVLIAAKSGFGWRDLLATFALWPATDQMTAPLVPVAWTLCFEVLFYTAAALVLVDRRWLYGLLALYAGAMMFRSAAPMLQFLGNPIIAEFLLGVLLFYAPRWRPAVIGIPVGAALIVLAGPLGISPDQGTVGALIGVDGFQRLFVYGIPAALIVYGAMQIEAKPSVWTYLGDASYSLYLVHVFVLSALWQLWANFPMPADFTIAVGTIASVLAAWRIHERIEKPILRALGRREMHGAAAYPPDISSAVIQPNDKRNRLAERWQRLCKCRRRDLKNLGLPHDVQAERQSIPSRVLQSARDGDNESRDLDGESILIRSVIGASGSGCKCAAMVS